LLQAFAIGMMYYSDLSILIKLGVSLLLLTHLVSFLFDRKQVLPYEKLVFHQNEWLLYNRDQIEGPYQTHRILLEAGIFFLLQLRLDQKQRLVVIFFDQIEADEYRTLRILEKMT
jgi:hypothetical protein